MLVRKFAFFAASFFLLNAFFVSCKTEDSGSFTGIKISVSKSVVNAGESVTVKAVYYKDDAADSSSTVTYGLISDTTGGAYFGSAGTTETSAKSGEAVSLTMGASNSAFVTVTASCNGSFANLTVKTSAKIGLQDIPTGYAGVDFESFYNASKVVTVSTKSDLVNYARQGGYTILIDGMIDLSEGMLPSSGGASNSALDAFVSSNSSYSTYSAYNTAMTSSISKSADWSNSLNSAYAKVIRVYVAGNTAIIGKTADCGVKGGGFYINEVSNVILRNLVIQDAYDPFPNHEANDGWNAQHDNIHIEKSTNVWVDHCTIEDTLKLATGANGEKWQTYDGLCDITNMKSSKVYVTVSNCHFKNHDKTMLIGSSDSDGDNSKRFVSLIGNYFENCGQRLPMVRNTTVHVLNNYYVTSGSPYSSQSCVNARKNAIVYAENNYFGSGCKYSFNAASSDSTPVLHASGNAGETASSTSNISAADSTLFSVAVNAYSYTAVTAAEAKTNAQKDAGAGCTIK